MSKNRMQKLTGNDNDNPESQLEVCIYKVVYDIANNSPHRHFVFGFPPSLVSNKLLTRPHMENKDSSSPPQNDSAGCSDDNKRLASKWDRTLLKISKLFRNSQKVCRGLAILDAVVSILVLAVFLARKVYVTLRRSQTTDDHIIKVVFLSWKLFEIVFALILYEGVRREIKWMVKWWLIYCIGRLTIVYPFAIYKIYESSTSSLISITGLLVCLGLIWVIFQLIQGIIILAIHKNPQESLDDEDEDSHNEEDFEQFELELQSEPIKEEERA